MESNKKCQLFYFIVSIIRMINCEILSPPVLNSVLANVKDLSLIDPEWNMTTSQIIRYHGYPAEEHDVVTEDGYILTIHRIPHGKKKYNGKLRNPLILQHGLMVTSSSWVMNVPDKNIVYKLVDAGYDVWLGNIRGNSYGKRHLVLSPEDDEFWNFSFDEMGKYDMPAIIDYVIKTTGTKQIDYVGHSMGTVIISIALVTRPEYNDKIRVAGYMAPALSLRYTTCIAFEFLPISPIGELISRKAWGSEAALNSRVLRSLIALTCVRFPSLCENVLPRSLGAHGHHNMSRIPVYASHFPDTTSLQTLLHYRQLRTSPLQMRDFGPKRNIKIYKQCTPPLYNISQITTPIFIFWSETDFFANAIEVANLIIRLPSYVLDYKIGKFFAHHDYVVADDANELVGNQLLEVLNTIKIPSSTRNPELIT